MHVQRNWTPAFLTSSSCMHRNGTHVLHARMGQRCNMCCWLYDEKFCGQTCNMLWQVFKHKHEIESGRTSSLSQQLLGYAADGGSCLQLQQ